MATTTATETWAIDPTHSSAEFIVKHLMVSKVRGSFSNFKGTIVTAAGGNVPEKVSAEIDVTSVNTNVGDRDTHLKSPDFFHAENHPVMTFESTSVHQHDDDLEVEGNLTIRGTTRKVLLEGQFEGRAKDPWGNDRIAFSAETKINRKDYGLTYNQALEAGGVMVGEEVKIELNIQAIKQQ